jgi:hypothetical protein
MFWGSGHLRQSRCRCRPSGRTCHGCCTFEACYTRGLFGSSEQTNHRPGEEKHEPAHTHTHSCDDTPYTVAQRQEPGGELGPTLHWQIPVELQVAFPPQSTAAEHPSQGQTAETPKHREKKRIRREDGKLPHACTTPLQTKTHIHNHRNHTHSHVRGVSQLAPVQQGLQWHFPLEQP